MPLPPALTSVLTTIGNGIFFGHEEVFGPRRLMIHDIELLPDMMSVKAASPGLPEAWLPFHRRDGVVQAASASARAAAAAAQAQAMRERAKADLVRQLAANEADNHAPSEFADTQPMGTGFGALARR